MSGICVCSYQASISERLQKIREEQGCSLGEARRRLWQEQWGGAEGAGCSADAELREEPLDLPPASDMTRSGVLICVCVCVYTHKVASGI